VVATRDQGPSGRTHLRENKQKNLHIFATTKPTMLLSSLTTLNTTKLPAPNHQKCSKTPIKTTLHHGKFFPEKSASLD
jgi:hypothetical protein